MVEGENTASFCQCARLSPPSYLEKLQTRFVIPLIQTYKPDQQFVGFLW